MRTVKKKLFIPLTELRNDDVLQVKVFSNKMGYATREKSLFQWFKDTDKIFKKYNCKSTLAVLSEGIDEYPEWVAYIKKNLHRYQIELHGLQHDFYDGMPEWEGYINLRKAKTKIENTFDVEVTTWYVPFGRKKFPKWGQRVCNRLGIDFDVTHKYEPMYYFHYWYHKDIERVNYIVEKLCNPTSGSN